jgi:hypothetical protein
MANYIVERECLVVILRGIVFSIQSKLNVGFVTSNETIRGNTKHGSLVVVVSVDHFRLNIMVGIFSSFKNMCELAHSFSRFCNIRESVS